MSVIEKNNEPTEAFLFMQSEENVDGIYIKSREIALQAKKSFLTGLEDATPLTGAKGRKIIESAKKKLHEKHKA